MRRKYRCAAGLLAVILCHGAQAGERCSVLRFEPRQTISIRELRQMAAEMQQPGAGNGGISYWWFDSEDYPEKKGWSAVAIAMATTGDLGETPVAGIVWTNRAISSRGDYSARVASAKDAVVPDFDGGVVFQAVRASKRCKSTTLTLSTKGTKVFADGKLVGTIVNP